MLGWVWLRGLRLPFAHVGVHAHEQGVEQTLIVHAGLHVDISAAARDDDVASALDWAAAETHIVEVVRRRHYKLIETLVQTLATSLLDTFARIDSIDLCVEKQGCLQYGSGAVQLLLHRHKS